MLCMCVYCFFMLISEGDKAGEYSCSTQILRLEHRGSNRCDALRLSWGHCKESNGLLVGCWASLCPIQYQTESKNTMYVHVFL